VILEESENALMSYLKIIKSRRQACRCVYIKTENFSDEGFGSLPSILEQILGNQDIGLYVCNESIFVTAADIPFKTFLNIEKAIIGFYIDDPAFREEALSLFDVTSDFEKIVWLLENVIVKKERKDKKMSHVKDAIYKAEKRMHILQDSYDGNALNTISERRLLHKDPVILLVEDDAFTAKLVSASIGGGVKVLIAENGKEAIDKYISEAPDIVFLDIELPDISGYDVLEKIKAFDKDIFAVMLSSHGNTENVSRAVKMEVRGFVSKPFAREKLLKHIKTAIEEKKSRG